MRAATPAHLQLANGTAMPTDSAHSNPTLNGMCTSGAATLVCISGVCDPNGNACGYAVGDGSCTSSNGSVVCDSGACSTTGICEPAGGCEVNADCSTGNVCKANACVPGCSISGVFYPANTQNPANSCQVCIPASSTTAWSSVSNGTACNDGNLCTQGDVCQSGTCVGEPVVCNPSDACHVAGTCNPSTGACSNPTAPDGTTCNDGNACTQSDVCQSGTCTGTPVVCTASDACHTAGTCNPSTGACSNPTAPNGTSCGTGETCESGVCQATQFVLTTAAYPSAGGVVTPPSGGLYNQGTLVPIGASANPGYTFLNWTSTGKLGSTTSANTTIDMESAESVTANFSASLVVNTANDDAGDASQCTAQATPGTNTSDSACSLRDALLFAANAPAASITFDGTAFAASNTTKENTITLGSAGSLNIPPNTTITGPTTGSGAKALDLVTVDGNRATSVFVLSTGSASITNLAIANGSAAIGGGGINSSGALTVSNSTFFGNSATAGGAIYDAGSALTVIDSTFINDTALSAGGGIWSNSGQLQVVNSTLTGNASNGKDSVGGGISIQSGTPSLANNIVSGNTALTNPDIDGTYNDRGGNVVGGNANLSALGNYGGATQTVLPLPGSPALCAGTQSNANTFGITSDQRGLAFDSNCPTGSIDSGAVQSDYALNFTTSPNDTTAGQTLTPTPLVTLTESGTPVIAGAVSVSMTAATGTLNGTTTASTSTSPGPTAGQAAFSALNITPAESADVLTATVALTSTINLTANSSSFNVTAPDTAPTVFSTSPTNGATSVSPASTVSFTFNKAVNVTLTAFTLQCPNGKSAAFKLSPNPPGGVISFTLTPTANLPFGVTCKATAVASQIADLAGTNLAANYSLSFTTMTATPATLTSRLPEAVCLQAPASLQLDRPFRSHRIRTSARHHSGRQQPLEFRPHYNDFSHGQRTAHRRLDRVCPSLHRLRVF